MSMSFIPEDLMPDVKTMEAQFDRMSRDFSAMFSDQAAGSVNLMMQPFAAGAAFGAGLAGQALGAWMGAVAGSMDAAQKMSVVALRSEVDDDDAPAYKAPKSPARRVKAAVDTLAEDVEDATRAAIQAGGETALAIEKDFADAVDAVAQGNQASGAGQARDAIERAADRPAVDFSAGPDDLKMISGIGAKMEQVLNGLGVWTYAQIAAWSEKDIARVEEHLGFKGRIGRDAWQKQAAELMKRTS
ncbi:NADH-ubiquinone dehydrogenase [Mesorhizobium xinjiangense]|uniref:NADH-ubiquinone dehydrogenase n=1 Tax=Mesorhizobium xinjiangense TaxID=2678685 RepID=UPI0012ECF19C|nr:NADH-ubiquinone dehydrogenase [Mesorhizobium xinjiangense]